MSHPPGWRGLLGPLTPLYRLGWELRNQRLDSGHENVRRLPSPVVSIGNLSTGGAGKTPLTIALAQALSARGCSVDVLSRGYGRQSSAVARVAPAGSAEEFGDEPLLIARLAKVPVYVAAQRYEAGQLAETDRSKKSIDAERSIHLLDDGFQHRQLHRDLDIVLLNRADWEDRLLPAGNLREPLSALRRASVMVIPAGESEFEEGLRSWGWTGPLWRVHRHMEISRPEGAVFAFCGIARPAQFFAGLESSGIPVAGTRAFPDHHRYTRRELDLLAAQARAVGAAALLTTEKDAVRLGKLAAPLPILTAGLRTEIEDQPAAINWVLDTLFPA